MSPSFFSVLETSLGTSSSIAATPASYLGENLQGIFGNQQLIVLFEVSLGSDGKVILRSVFRQNIADLIKFFRCVLTFADN